MGKPAHLATGHLTGRIEPGIEADMVFLTADPVADMANIAKVSGVLTKGRLIHFSDLMEQLP